jgi:hypothetical protein
MSTKCTAVLLVFVKVMDYHPSPMQREKKKFYTWVCRIHDYERGMPELGIEIKDDFHIYISI